MTKIEILAWLMADGKSIPVFRESSSACNILSLGLLEIELYFLWIFCPLLCTLYIFINKIWYLASLSL